VIAGKFHHTLAAMVVAVAKERFAKKVLLTGGCFQNRACSPDVRAIHLVRIAQPQAVIGSNVENGIAAGHCLLERSRIAQVANCRLGFQSFKILQIAGRANQKPEASPLIGKSTGNMRAEESGGAGDES